MATVIWDGPLGVAVLTNVYDPLKAKSPGKKRRKNRKQVSASLTTLITLAFDRSKFADIKLIFITHDLVS